MPAGGSWLPAFLMALFLFGFGLYGHGVYLAELQRLNGWPAALISGASTLSLLLSNILAAFTNELVARLGPKRLVLLGLAALAASMALLAFATSPWQLYAAFVLMSLGWIGMGTIVIATIVSLWFVQPPRPRHQPGIHRRKLRRDRRHALARVPGRTVRLSGRDADRDCHHGPAVLVACRFRLDRRAPAPAARSVRETTVETATRCRDDRPVACARSCAGWRSGRFRSRLRWRWWLRSVSSCTRSRYSNQDRPRRCGVRGCPDDVHGDRGSTWPRPRRRQARSAAA